jgi:hypothetical protein
MLMGGIRPCRHGAAAMIVPATSTAWGSRGTKFAVRAILTNPRYTGCQVWNKQRKDECCSTLRTWMNETQDRPEFGHFLSA